MDLDSSSRVRYLDKWKLTYGFVQLVLDNRLQLLSAEDENEIKKFNYRMNWAKGYSWLFAFFISFNIDRVIKTRMSTQNRIVLLLCNLAVLPLGPKIVFNLEITSRYYKLAQEYEEDVINRLPDLKKSIKVIEIQRYEKQTNDKKERDTGDSNGISSGERENYVKTNGMWEDQNENDMKNYDLRRTAEETIKKSKKFDITRSGNKEFNRFGDTNDESLQVFSGIDNEVEQAKEKNQEKITSPYSAFINQGINQGKNNPVYPYPSVKK